MATDELAGPANRGGDAGAAANADDTAPAARSKAVTGSTETSAANAPAEAATPPLPAPAGVSTPPRHPALWPLWIAVLALAGASGYLLLRPAPDLRPAIQAQLAAALGALDRRVAGLEARPPAAAPDLAPLAARIGALEARAPGADASAAGEAALGAALGPLSARLTALERRPVPPAGVSAEQLAMLEGRVAALEARPAAGDLAARVAAAETAASIARAAVAISLRLAAGEPLAPALVLLPAGTAVPAALEAFAASPPPTLTGLRRDFPAAIRAARDAATTAGDDPATTVRNFFSGLLTLRRGEELLFGTSDAAALAAAEARLGDGDLAGALTALGTLSASAAGAMAPWRAQAQALLDARSALDALSA